MVLFSFETNNSIKKITEVLHDNHCEDALGSYMPIIFKQFGVLVILLYRESAHIEESSKATPYFYRNSLLCIGFLKNKLSGIAMGDVIRKTLFPVLFLCGIIIGGGLIYIGLLVAFAIYVAIEISEYKNEKHMLNNLKIIFERK